MQPTGTATKDETSERIEVFQYPDGSGSAGMPDWNEWAEGVDGGDGTLLKPVHEHFIGAAEAGLRSEFDLRMAEETRRSFEAGRESGRLEGRQVEREGQLAAEKQRVQRGAELIEQFAQERDRYLRQVEHEVVELALAIAARILRREAQMDPLLLTGAVRVALGQLSGSTQVRVRVPLADLDLWTETLAILPNLQIKPQVLAAEGMRLGDCAIETEVGSVDLGIRAQLGEIERGFFDRAGVSRAEPAAAPSALQPVGQEVCP